MPTRFSSASAAACRPRSQLDALRQHIAAGKPVIGIRTACHAWCLRNEKEQQALLDKGHAAWPEFDPDVLGGNYTNHHGDGPKTKISVPIQIDNRHVAIFGGIDLSKLVGNGSLYKVSPLTNSASPLLMGTIDGKVYESEPVAWTNLAGPNKARVFNTSLGHPADFDEPAFRKLLVNGLFWALEKPLSQRRANRRIAASEVNLGRMVILGARFVSKRHFDARQPVDIAAKRINTPHWAVFL